MSRELLITFFIKQWPYATTIIEITQVIFNSIMMEREDEYT